MKDHESMKLKSLQNKWPFFTPPKNTRSIDPRFQSLLQAPMMVPVGTHGHPFPLNHRVCLGMDTMYLHKCQVKMGKIWENDD
jgi:hypothetical protein